MNALISIREFFTGIMDQLFRETTVGLVLVLMAAAGCFLWLMHRLILKRSSRLGSEARLPRQLLFLLVVLVTLIGLVLVVPMSEAIRGSILGLIGVVITGIIALSSTSFVANIMAGLMLRVIRSFKPGDFIHIGDAFGRVTERGLIHVEIQTEDRNLTTFPNLYLVTNPVTVVRSSGTIISTTLSLGYDLPRLTIENHLKEAAVKTGLQDAFVQVQELGDFSVTYRIAGFYPEVKHLLTARSELRKSVMDVLHGKGIEIVSPTFMNQRRMEKAERTIPVRDYSSPREKSSPDVPEDMMFDKAEVAETIEQLKSDSTALQTQIEALGKSIKSAGKDEKPALTTQLVTLERRKKILGKKLEIAQKDVED